MHLGGSAARCSDGHPSAGAPCRAPCPHTALSSCRCIQRLLLYFTANVPTQPAAFVLACDSLLAPFLHARASGARPAAADAAQWPPPPGHPFAASQHASVTRLPAAMCHKEGGTAGWPGSCSVHPMALCLANPATRVCYNRCCRRARGSKVAAGPCAASRGRAPHQGGQPLTQWCWQLPPHGATAERKKGAGGKGR